jgi:hypothetical protein
VQEAFGTTDEDAICLEILSKGELQVGALVFMPCPFLRGGLRVLHLAVLCHVMSCHAAAVAFDPKLTP